MIIDISKINIDLDEVVQIESKEQALQDSRLDALATQQRIKAYYRLNRRLIRWGFTNQVFKPVHVVNSNQLLSAIKEYSLDGKGMLSTDFLNRCYGLLDRKLRSSRVKVNGLIHLNLETLRDELKFLKGRKREYQSLEVDNSASVRFVDKSLSYKFIVSKLIDALTTIIDRGYQFKKTKRYVSLCKIEESPTVYVNNPKEPNEGLILGDKVTGKASSVYRKAYAKVYMRKIRQLNSMPILGYSTDGKKITSYTSYVKKDLPLYLQD